MDDDEYWNTSETSARAFSFDDDLLSPQEMLAIGKANLGGVSGAVAGEGEGVLGSATVKPALLSIASLISPAAMQLILQAQSGATPEGTTKATVHIDDSITSTLRRLVLRRPCSLHIHRTLADKTKLLDGAVALGDGDSILTVVLFLIQTLQTKLAYGLLSSRPLALSHYVSFLLAESKLTDLTDLLTMLGKSPEAAMYQFEHMVKSHTDVHSLLNKLRHLQANHFSQPGYDSVHVTAVDSYIKFLEWQLCTSLSELHNRSVLQCVAYCCARHWQDTAGKMMSPLTLCQQQQLSPQQYDWVALNVHATLQNWDTVESLFTRKNWLGKTSMSSGVPLTLMVQRLYELGVGKRLLGSYIANIPDADQRLQVAKQYKVHAVVMELLVKARDRVALTGYKMSLQPHSEEYFLAENALQDPAIKWKN